MLPAAFRDPSPRIMSTHLKNAHPVVGQGPLGQYLDPSKELSDLLNALQVMYRDNNLQINLDVGSAGNLPIDREDMLELAANQIDNGGKWARSRVDIRLRSTDRETRLIVEDDGPGVFEEKFESLSGRGVRLDETLQGQGLGLSIARLISEQYHGALLFDRSEKLGGLRATAVLNLDSIN